MDADLAVVYGTETKYIKRAVKRNPDRFPNDFIFELTKEEADNLRFQIGTSSWGGSRYLPYAFTEHGAVMLASVLNTPAAIQASIYVVKAFITLRNVIGMYKDLELRISELERSTSEQFKEQGEHIEKIIKVLKQFVAQENGPRKQIGFKRENEK